MLFYDPINKKTIVRECRNEHEFSKNLHDAWRNGWIYQNTHYISEEEIQYELDKNKCPVHGIGMAEKYEPPAYGLMIVSDKYYKARDEHFPNCGDPEIGGCCVPPEQMIPYNQTFFCKECIKAKKKWKEENPDEPTL